MILPNILKKRMFETTNQLLDVSIAMFNEQTIQFGDAVASEK